MTLRCLIRFSTLLRSVYLKTAGSRTQLKWNLVACRAELQVTGDWVKSTWNMMYIILHLLFSLDWFFFSIHLIVRHIILLALVTSTILRHSTFFWDQIFFVTIFTLMITIWNPRLCEILIYFYAKPLCMRFLHCYHVIVVGCLLCFHCLHNKMSCFHLFWNLLSKQLQNWPWCS